MVILSPRGTAGNAHRNCMIPFASMRYIQNIQPMVLFKVVFSAAGGTFTSLGAVCE